MYMLCTDICTCKLYNIYHFLSITFLPSFLATCNQKCLQIAYTNPTHAPHTRMQAYCTTEQKVLVSFSVNWFSLLSSYSIYIYVFLIFTCLPFYCNTIYHTLIYIQLNTLTLQESPYCTHHTSLFSLCLSCLFMFHYW